MPEAHENQLRLLQSDMRADVQQKSLRYGADITTGIYREKFQEREMAERCHPIQQGKEME